MKNDQQLIYGQFEQFMTPDEADLLRSTGIVTVTMLMHSDPEAVAERTGLDPVWLKRVHDDSFNREWPLMTKS